MPPTLTDIAKALVAHELGSAESAGEVAAAAARIFEKLHGHFARILGDAGVRALLGRSVSLARAEYPRLPGPDSVWDQVPWRAVCSFLEEEPLEAAIGAFEHILSAVLGLVARFIGDDLTGRLVAEVWPGIPQPKETL